jgi:hypothetical protein
MISHEISKDAILEEPAANKVLTHVILQDALAP